MCLSRNFSNIIMPLLSSSYAVSWLLLFSGFFFLGGVVFLSWNNLRALLRRLYGGLLICLNLSRGSGETDHFPQPLWSWWVLRNTFEYRSLECESWWVLRYTFEYRSSLGCESCLCWFLALRSWASTLGRLSLICKEVCWADVCRWSILVSCVLGSQWMSCSLMPY